MQPRKLYIQNFMCFDHAYIDFSQFSSALIVGKKENNDHISNGVGKTSLFKAIEYVLFNEADVTLENVILENMDFCRVAIDFLAGEQEYRLSRKRTIKGNSDLILLQRNAQLGNDNEVYHSIIVNSAGDNNYEPYLDRVDFEKYWKDLSGSRAGDTEKDLYKLIKFTHKSFRATVHFMQDDKSGLPTVSAEKRKNILKDALNLSVYAKLEKIAKEKASLIEKEIDKNQIIMDGFGSPENDISILSSKLEEIETELIGKNIQLFDYKRELDADAEVYNKLTQEHSALENKYIVFLGQKSSIQNDCAKLDSSIKEYTDKKHNVLNVSKNLIQELSAFKETQKQYLAQDFSQIEILLQQIEDKKNEGAKLSAEKKNNLATLEELKYPLPAGGVCKTCRKPMSENERETCQEHINQEIKRLQVDIQQADERMKEIMTQVSTHRKHINDLQAIKNNLQTIDNNIKIWDKDIQDKKNTHITYVSLLTNFKAELEQKTNTLKEIDIQLHNSSINEANILKNKISQYKEKIHQDKNNITELSLKINQIDNNKAITLHAIEQKTIDKKKKEDLKEKINNLQIEYAKYPSVIQGFSSAGIPNLIIQNVLDDLQIEANDLLKLLKPGLQLSFLIEKTTGKGEQEETLDIKYMLNGKPRYYEQLSGAQRLSVLFSLKLGLSFVLKKRIGVDIKLLLLDEIDQSLDKASVDALADIIKFFQNDFTILAITHNDRSQEKFQNVILVDQNIDMISRAKVMSAW